MLKAGPKLIIEYTRSLIQVGVGIFFAICMLGCASRILKSEHSNEMKTNKEFESIVKIEIPVPENVVSPKLSTDSAPAAKKNVADKAPSQIPPLKKKKTKKEKAAEKSDAQNAESLTVTRHLPEIEGDIGFVGRRPIKDPFVVGEKVTHEVHYFKVSAGKLSFEVKPFVFVNGRKSYSFKTSIVTSSMFSTFYTADDYSETLVDFENMVPTVFALHVQESAQLKEGKSFFDYSKKMALYWETKITEKSGKEEKKQEWAIEDYSQNVFSAAYYMRVFQWEVGKENVFRVADDGENITFRAKAIRKETLKTEVGPMEAIVIKPEFDVKGVFKPVGDIYIWLSNDERKYILRIESKIKIGTLVSEIIELVPGQP